MRLEASSRFEIGSQFEIGAAHVVLDAVSEAPGVE